jgi:hypothetical protein
MASRLLSLSAAFLIAASLAAGGLNLFSLPDAFAAGPVVGGGDRIQEGLDRIKNEADVPTDTKDFRTAIADAVRFLVNFVALAAIITIIAAGFFLILGFGTDGSIQRAKKIFIYTILGIFVIFFARVIVAFFTTEVPSVF